MEMVKPRKVKTPKQLRLDCNTGVNLNYSHGFGIWGNPRVVMGVRVDEKLKKAFTKVAKAKFGSTCNPIESFMAAIVGLSINQNLNEVNLSPTVNIGEIKIERNLRERRKLVVETEETERVVSSVVKCGYVDCGEAAVGKAVYLNDNQEYSLCDYHFRKAKDSKRFWKVLTQ